MKDSILIFLLALAAYTLTAGGHLYSPDEEVLYRVTESLYEDHDLAIEPLFGFATKRAENGLEYAQYGVGQPVLALPFYAAGKFLAPLAPLDTWKRIYGVAADEPDLARGFPVTAAGLASRFACSFFNIVLSALFAALVYLLVLEITEHRAASILAALLYALGSLAWAHSRPFFTEVAAVFFIVLAWYAVLRAMRGRMSPWLVLAGAAAGYSALIRMDSILMYPGLALLLTGPVLRAIPERKPIVHPFVAFALPAALCGGALLFLNYLHFGGPFATGYSDQPEGVKFPTPLLAGLYGFLFSMGKGMFFFSPALVLGLFGWPKLVEKGAMLAGGVAASILLPLLFMSKWQNWTGGWCWGPRHIFMIHPFLAIPAAVWLAEGWGSVRRTVALSLLAVGVGVQLLGCSQDFIKFYQIFFRSHGELTTRVLYDDYDKLYWDEYFKLSMKPPNRDTFAQVDLGYVPAPTQHSIYIPQSSVWYCYPRMWRELRMVDNLWIRLARGE